MRVWKLCNYFVDMQTPLSCKTCLEIKKIKMRENIANIRCALYKLCGSFYQNT